MARLRGEAIRAIVEFLWECYAFRDLESFVAHLLSALPKIVPCEAIAFNEYNPLRNRIHYVVEPAEAEPPGGRPLLERYMHEHPVVAYYIRTGDGRAIKISDFFTRSQYHRLGLYNEFFRLAHPSVEDLMGALIAWHPRSGIGLTLCRHSHTFTEHDRLCLNLLRPHLIQAYRNAEAVTLLQQKLATTRQALEVLDRGVIILGRQGRIRLMTTKACQWMAEYFKCTLRVAARLPQALREWVGQTEARFRREDDVPAPCGPLVVEREGKRLVVRLLLSPPEMLLLIEEQRIRLTPASLEPFGLTRREAEVLAWVAQGKTNPDIAVILNTSRRTVGKHLERIYQKLGVETRTAAAALALSGSPKP